MLLLVCIPYSQGQRSYNGEVSTIVAAIILNHTVYGYVIWMVNLLRYR